MGKIVELDLNFANLMELDDGRIAKLLLHHLGNISRDCINRPTDKSKRKVTLEFYATPEPHPDTGDAETAHIEIECKSKVPVYRSRKFQMRLNNKGFSFNKDFPDDISQPSLFPETDGDHK